MVFQLAAGGARANAATAWMARGQLVHEFDGLFGAGNAVFVTPVQRLLVSCLPTVRLIRQG